MNKYPAILFTATSFLLAWALILLSYLQGDPANSLHQSAQAWAFTVVLGILAAYGIGSLNLNGTFFGTSSNPAPTHTTSKS